MSKVRVIAEPQLPALMRGKNQRIKYFDAFIYQAFIHSQYVDGVDVEVLSLQCQRIVSDDEPRDENGKVVRDWGADDYCMITIAIDNEHECSSYFQFITAIFHNEDIPVKKFSLNEIKGRFVRIIVSNESLLAIHPLTDITEKMRDYYKCC